MRRSGDFFSEQAISVMGPEQPEQVIVDFRIPCWNRKSLALSCLSVMLTISWCREEVISKSISLCCSSCCYIMSDAEQGLHDADFEPAYNHFLFERSHVKYSVLPLRS